MHRQTIYDVVLYGIRVQGGPSMKDKDNCAYRDNNGNRCAIGMWISDAVYDPEIEGTSAWALGQKFPAINFPVWFAEQGYFMSQLQIAHDDSARYDLDEPFMDKFERRMEKLAEDFHLIYIPPGSTIPDDSLAVYQSLKEMHDEQV